MAVGCLFFLIVMTINRIGGIVDFQTMGISLGDVYEAMGGSCEHNPELEIEVRHIMDELAGMVSPLFMTYIINGDTELLDDALVIDGKRFSIGRIIAGQLRRSQAYALFVATAGAEFEKWQRSLNARGDMLKTYIADCIGSVIAERCADAMEDALRKEIEPAGWHITNRYSPGYCGWNVSEQQSLFSIFPDDKPCGVTLTDSSMMIPIKSVSGIIGLGAEVRRREYTCGICSFASCFRRKKA